VESVERHDRIEELVVEDGDGAGLGVEVAEGIDDGPSPR
jgi:hypothetical protein